MRSASDSRPVEREDCRGSRIAPDTLTVCRIAVYGSAMCCWSPYSMVWALLCVKGVWCLRMVALHVPSRVIVGDTIRLTCKFDLEGDTLYSIKWYRDDIEFYRFVPRDRPPGQYFPMEGVRVDMLRSVNNTVILEEIDTSTSGKFKCEVSADAPSFQTEVAKTELRVKEFYADSSSRLSYGMLCFSGLLLAILFS